MQHYYLPPPLCFHVNEVFAAELPSSIQDDNEHFPDQTNVTLNGDFDKKDNSGTFTLNDKSNNNKFITVENTQDKDNPGKLTIQNFDTLNFLSDSDNKNTAGVTLWAAENTQVNIKNIGTINFGTKDQALKSDQGVMAAGGNMTLNADTIIGNVTGNGFMSQSWGSHDGTLKVEAKNINLTSQSGGLVAAGIFQKTPNNTAINTIHATDHIYLHAKKLDAGVAYLYDSQGGQGKATINILGDKGVGLVNEDGMGIYSGLNDDGNEGTINITSKQGEASIISTNNAVQLNSTQATDASKGNKTTVKISGDQGVKIISRDGRGLYTNLSGDKNQGTIDVISNKEDVLIQANNEAITSSFTNNASTTMNVSGNNVNVESTNNTAIDLNGNTQLKLAATKDQGVIRIHDGNPDHLGIHVGDNSSLSIGDKDHTNVVSLNGQIKVSDKGTVTVADKTTTVVDADSLGKNPLVSVSGGTFTAEDDAKLIVTGADTGDTLYTKEGEQSKVNFWNVKNTSFDNPFQYLSTDGKVLAGITDANKDSIAGYIVPAVAVAATGKNDKNISTLLTNGKDVYNGAVGIGQAGGIQHGTYAMTGLFTDALTDHDDTPDTDIWAKGFHRKESIDGLGFDGGALSMDAQYNGTVIGADVYQKQGKKAGVAMIYADGNVDGNNGGVYTKNNAKYLGASLYAQKTAGSYRLATDLSYLGGSHDLKQYNGNQTITAKPDTEAWTVGVKAMKNYDFTHGTLTPYVGFRYLRLTTDGYTSSVGLSYDKENQNMYLLPVGVDYAMHFNRGSWDIKPYAGLSYMWTMGDRNADQHVSYGSATDVFSYDVSDAGSFLGKVGVSATKGDYTFGLGYAYQTGSTTDSHTWIAQASYAF